MILLWATHLAVSKIQTRTQVFQIQRRENLCSMPPSVAQGCLHWQRSFLTAFWRGRTKSCDSLQEPSLFCSDQPCNAACCQPSLTGLHWVITWWNDACVKPFCLELFLFLCSAIPSFSSRALSPTAQILKGLSKLCDHLFLQPQWKKERGKNQVQYAVRRKSFESLTAVYK